MLHYRQKQFELPDLHGRLRVAVFASSHGRLREMRHHGLLLVFCLCLAAQLCPALGVTKVVVAADGTGDFKTIQMAIDHAPPYGVDEKGTLANWAVPGKMLPIP